MICQLSTLGSKYSRQNCQFLPKLQSTHHRRTAIALLTLLTMLIAIFTSFASILDSLSSLICSTYESETFAFPTKLSYLSIRRPHTYEHCSTTLSVPFFNFSSSCSYLNPRFKPGLLFQGKGAPQIP